MTKRQTARWMGMSLIAILWLVTGYILVYYSVLLCFGHNRLYALLGQRLYNALFPGGGFDLLLTIALYGLVVWATPLVAFGALALGSLRLLTPHWRTATRMRASAVAAVLLTAALPVVLLDGWPASLWSLSVEQDTEYARTYSAVGFWVLRPGMTQERVLALVGEPLERYAVPGQPEEEVWRWTRSPGGTSYRVRAIDFRSGKVIAKYAQFHFD